MTKTEFHVQNALRELVAARKHVEAGELERAFSQSSERFAFRGDISDVVSRATVFLDNIFRASQSNGTDRTAYSIIQEAVEARDTRLTELTDDMDRIAEDFLGKQRSPRPERRMADSLDETAQLLAQVRKLVRMVELEFPKSPVKLVEDPDGT